MVSISVSVIALLGAKLTGGEEVGLVQYHFSTRMPDYSITFTSFRFYFSARRRV